MSLKLMDLRRYAIENRTGIRFADPDSGQECLIDINGQVRSAGHDNDFRVEDVLAAARAFQLTGQGKTQTHTRDQMAEIVSEAFKKRATAAPSKDSE